MKLDILFLCSVIGVGLAIFLERFLLSPYPLTSPASPAPYVERTGDPVRDFMNSHY